MNQPQNDLERALWAVSRGPEGYPELFRQLRESMVTFLMPYHPEWVGDIPIENGTAITFAVWKNADGPQIPLFTSLERAETALQATGARNNQYGVAEMKGEWLFGAIAGQKLPAVLNPACGTPHLSLDVRAARKLADGSILEMDKGQEEKGRIKIVDAADYPTDLLQPVFKFLRGKPEVRAAWLFYRLEKDDSKQRYYVFGLLVRGDSEAVKSELSVVIRHAKKSRRGFGVTALDPNQPEMKKVLAKFPPFYAAPDYRAPGPVD
jgi:hypothetical protein